MNLERKMAALRQAELNALLRGDRAAARQAEADRAMVGCQRRYSAPSGRAWYEARARNPNYGAPVYSSSVLSRP